MIRIDAIETRLSASFSSLLQHQTALADIMRANHQHLASTLSAEARVQSIETSLLTRLDQMQSAAQLRSGNGCCVIL